MRKLLFFLCILGLTYSSLAQAGQASWASLSTLRAGENIQVLDTASKKHSGAFESVSDTAISYKETAGEHSVQRQDVRSVKLMKNNHRLRNTLIGAGIGAGAGAGITAAGWESSGFLGSKGVGAAVGAIIGGTSGAVVGALIPSHDAIYKASSH